MTGVMPPPKSNVICCVPQCSSRANRKERISFHAPSECMRKKWTVAIRTGKKMSPHMRVCSRHFKEDDFFVQRPYASSKSSSSESVSGKDQWG